MALPQQYGSYITKMSDGDRETLQITDPKEVQGKIDAQPHEKALQASAEKVAFGQLGICQRSIAEATSEAIGLSTFKAKDDNSPLALEGSPSGGGPIGVWHRGLRYYKMPPKSLQSNTPPGTIPR